MLKQTFDDTSALRSPINFKFGTHVHRATHVLRTKFQLSTLISFHFINDFAGICVVIGNLTLYRGITSHTAGLYFRCKVKPRGNTLSIK